MCGKKFAGFILFAFLFSFLIVYIADAQYEESPLDQAYRMGYYAGYASTSRATAESAAVNATSKAYGATNDNNRQLKRAYHNGFVQGITDKRNGYKHRYL